MGPSRQPRVAANGLDGINDVQSLRKVPLGERMQMLQSKTLRPITSHADAGSLPFDAMLDSMFAVYHDIQQTSTDNPHFTRFSQRFAPILEYLGALRLNSNDFEVVQKLASGAFGMVSLVRGRHDGKLYALKALRKTTVLKQENVFYMEERNVMAFAESNWITSLYAAFQDEQNLYLVMEYLPGGDLISLLEAKDNTSLTEDEARFYLAQLVAAVEELHRQKFAHRDLKPHNILIDRDGHIKLADFGSCIQVGSDGKVHSCISVGTPDYISPEVLSSQEGKGSSYGLECDWWAVGVVIYEVLCGDPPFYAETLLETYANIQKHKGDLEFPEDTDLSDEVKDLINKLLCGYENRLGRNGVDEIKSHPWFKGVDWKSLRSMKPPFVPQLDSEVDTRYFPKEEEDDVADATRSVPQRTFMGQQLPFIGYTYIRDNPIYDLQPTNSNSDTMDNTNALVPKEAAPSHTRSRSLIRHSNPEDQQQIRKLEETLDKEKEMTKALQMTVQEEKALLQEEEHSHKETRDKLCTLEDNFVQTVQKHDTQRKALEDQLHQVHAHRENVQKDLATVRGDLEKAQLIVSNLTTEQRAQKQKCDKLSEELSKSNQQVQSLRAETAEGKARVTSLLTQVAASELAANALRSQLSAKDREVTRLQNEVQNQNTLIASQKSEITSLIKKTTELEFQVLSINEQMSQEVNALEAEASDVAAGVQSDLIKARDELSSEREASRMLTAQLEQEVAHVQEMATQIHDLNESVAQLNSQARDNQLAKEQLEQELKQRAEEINQLQGQVSNSEASVERLEFALKAKESECDTLTCSLHSKEQELQQAIDRGSTLDIKISGLQGQLHENEDRTHEVNGKNKELAEDLMFMRNKVKLQVDEIEQLQSRIKSQDEKLFKVQEQNALENSMGNLGDKSSKRFKSEYRDLQQRFAELQEKFAIIEKELHESKALVSQQQPTMKLLAMTPSSPFAPGLPSPGVPITEEDGRASATSALVRKATFLKRRVTRKTLTPGLSGLGHGAESNSSPIINVRGWLRIPKKDGFIRHGWKRKFFAVRESKLWMWEKEKDADTIEGTVMVDLTKVEFLAVGSVNSSDLFHATPKEIPCIFKIQSITSAQNTTLQANAATSLPSLSSSLNKPDDATSVTGSLIETLEQKIKGYKEKIEIETKLLQGADRLVQQSKGPFRQQATQQYQQCKDRITILEAELATCQKQFELVQHQHQHDPHPVANAPSSPSRLTSPTSIGSVSGDSPTSPHPMLQIPGISLKSPTSPTDIDSLMSAGTDGGSPLVAAFQVSGHHFKQHQFDNNFACRVCHDTLAPTHVALMCPMCNYTVHRHCAPVIDVHCQDARALNSALPLYFMCDTAEEKRKWILSLHAARKSFLTQRHGSAPVLPTTSGYSDLNTHSEVSEGSERSEKSALSEATPSAHTLTSTPSVSFALRPKTGV